MRIQKAPNLLIIVFFVSGFSSLVYQVAWQRILTLYYSVENISTTLIVSVYMLGLGLGAYLGGHFTERIKNLLIFYCLVELLIGIFGFCSIPLLEYIGSSTNGNNYAVSFTGMFLFLCIPTILMGITLPLLTKIYNNQINHFLNSVSYLYFINTLGAAAGCLLTSYLLISFFGLDTSIYCAAILNLAIAVIVFTRSRTFLRSEIIKNKTEDTTLEQVNPTSNSFLSRYSYFIIVFVTGFIAVGYEIIWFRFIGTIVKASPYAFSSILFIYLTGLALGSLFIRKYITDHRNIDRKKLFFTLQLFISLYVLLAIIVYYYLVKEVSLFSKINLVSFKTMEHPYPSLPRTDTIIFFFADLFNMIDVFLWPLAFIFIPTLCMGASFPLITSLARRNNETANTVGKIYFFTVAGNVTGGLLTGLVFLNVFGTELSTLILSIVGLSSILFIKEKRGFFQNKYKLPAVLLLVIIIILFPAKNQLYAVIHPKIEYHANEEKYINEGLDGVIVTYSYKDSLSTYINGMAHGGRPYMTFYYEAIEALSFKKELSSILVIGFGTGSTMETIQKAHPTVKVKLVELSPTLIKNLNHIDYLQNLLEHNSLDIVYADVRKYLNASSESFDAIFMDPLRTTTSFSNNLYSKEFFQLIKDHLSDDGVFMIWTDEHNIVPKTLSTVFSYVYKYSFFCLASKQDLKQDVQFKYDLFKKFPSVNQQELLNLDEGERNRLNRKEIMDKTRNYPINEDYKPHCEYYLGLNKY